MKRKRTRTRSSATVSRIPTCSAPPARAPTGSTVFRSTRTYTLKGSERVEVTASEVHKNDDVYFVEIEWVPPLLLCPTQWKRYQLTRDDVQHLLLDMPQPYCLLWQLYMVYGKDFNQIINFISPSFQSVFSNTFSSRRDVIKYLLEELSDYMSSDVGPTPKPTKRSKRKKHHNHTEPPKAEGCSRLMKSHPEHKPMCPFITVCRDVRKTLQAAVPEHPPSFRRRVTYGSVLDWKGAWYVPVESCDDDSVLCYRILGETDMNDRLSTLTLESKAVPLVMLPIPVHLNLNLPSVPQEMTFYVSDEAVFVCSAPG